MSDLTSVVEARTLTTDERDAALSMSFLSQQIANFAAQMNAIYERHPTLNEIQPRSFVESIPMSLDDWAVTAYQAKEDWLAMSKSGVVS